MRKAELRDIPRVAEILIFTKRTAYRPIFENDIISFNAMQVCKEADRLRTAHALDGVYVYDDGIVKGMLRREIDGRIMHLYELFIDPFFQKEGIGRAMISELVAEARKRHCFEIDLWVIEQNTGARKFYEKLGYEWTGNREPITEVEPAGLFRLKYRMKL